jgi:hypothetical protein
MAAWLRRLAGLRGADLKLTLRRVCLRQTQEDSRHVSFCIPGRNRVDERLVPPRVRTLRHGQRLTVGFPGEGLRPHVRNPDLNGTKPRLPQPGAMRADLIAGCGSSGGWHREVLHVAWNLAHRRSAAQNVHRSDGPYEVGTTPALSKEENRERVASVVY